MNEREGKEFESSDDEDIAGKLRREIMERDRLNRLGDDQIRKESIIRRPSSRSPTRILGSISEKTSKFIQLNPYI